MSTPTTSARASHLPDARFLSPVAQRVAPSPGSLFMFRLLHRGMCADATAFAAATTRVQPGDLPAAEALRDWFVRFVAVVDRHQRTKDEMLWPAVAAARHGFAPVHVEFTAALLRVRDAGGDVRSSLDAFVAEPSSSALLALRRAARTFEALLVELVEDEALRGLPVAARELGPAQLLAMDAEMRRRADPALLTFLGPWLLDHATPEEAIAIIERTPAPIVALGRTVWRRRYERSARHVRRERTPGSRLRRSGC